MFTYPPIIASVEPCCKANGVPADCSGLCVKVNASVAPFSNKPNDERSNYPNFCDMYRSKIDFCWKESQEGT